MKILFVCLGNICRSPTAEAFARARLPEHTIDSAGTSGWHQGDPPYPPVRRAAGARGIDMSNLYARQVISDDFHRFDLILAMDSDNVASLEGLRPDGNTTPVKRLMDFVDGEVGDVPDPYYTRDFDGALDLIEKGIAGLGRWIETRSE